MFCSNYVFQVNSGLFEECNHGGIISDANMDWKLQADIFIFTNNKSESSASEWCFKDKPNPSSCAVEFDGKTLSTFS